MQTTATKPKWKTWHKVIIALAVLLTIGVVKGKNEIDKNPASVAAKVVSQKETDSLNRIKRIEKNFSGWDGSQRNLVKLVKDNMNDPNSFEHATTKYFDVGENKLVVLMTYRGKNAFGGVVTQNVKVETDLDGNITKVFE